MSNNLIKRIVMAAIFGPIIIWICYQGGMWLFGMVMFFALLAIIEFLINENYRPKNFFFWLGLIFVALLITSRYGGITEEIIGKQILFNATTGLIFFFLISSMIFSVGRLSPQELFSKHSRLFWGIFYVGMLYPYVYLLGITYNQTTNSNVEGGDWLLLLFAILWVGDTTAMWVGKQWGKHKLAPAVSPHKTVEGFIGGILGAVLVGVIMYFWKFSQIAWYHILIVAVGCSVFGQLGDLVESMWKRSLGIKDSSAIIPGHGGVLDRFDSLLFAAPFLFFYKLLLIIR